MSAGGQDMPGGKTRDQWKRQQDEIERLQAALKEIAKYPSIEGSLARDTLEDKNDSL